MKLSLYKCWLLIVLLLLILSLAACSDSDGDDDDLNDKEVSATSESGSNARTVNPAPTSASTGSNSSIGERLMEVDDFLYQLQEYDLEAMGNSSYDLIVMDYSADGTEDEEFTREQIEALKHGPGGEKIVLSYMSIGEAEEYRYYWQSGWKTGSPQWLDEPNPNWIRNYKVQYWDPEWQQIVFDYTDRLINAGFDGAYLDIIDGYEYFGDKGREAAPQEMADFVAAIASHARARDPDFLVFPQNGAELASLVPGYLKHVDGIGQEDIYYGYDDDDRATPQDATTEIEESLDLFLAAGKLVLTTDYATTPDHVNDAYAKSRAKGYVPFVTQRDLDRLTINPGHEPD